MLRPAFLEMSRQKIYKRRKPSLHMGQIKDLVTSIERFIPGLSGYKGKELLREEDLALRRKLVEMLNAALSDLREAEKYAVMATGLDPTMFEELVVQKLEVLLNQISSGEAGYGGIFDQITIEETTLSKILENDKKLLETVDAFRKAAADAKAKAMSGNALDIQGLSSKLGEIATLVEKRRLLLRGGE